MAELNDRRRESSPGKEQKAELIDRLRESSPGLDLIADSVKWYRKQMKMEMQRLARPTDKQEVANFVKVVEKAFQYFDLKDFLAKHYGLEEYANYRSLQDFAHTLHDVPSQMNNIDALSIYDLAAAIEAHISSLRRARLPAPQHHNVNLFFLDQLTYSTFFFRYRRPHNSAFALLEDAKSDTACAPSPPKDPVSTLVDRLEKEDFYAFSDSTFRTVFLSRNRVYDMALCPKKELQKIKSSPSYGGDYVIFDEPAERWSEKGANAAIVAKKYEEACNKYKSLVLGLSRELKEGRISRELKEGRKKYSEEAREKYYEEVCNKYNSIMKKGRKEYYEEARKEYYEEACNKYKYKSFVLGLSREVKAPEAPKEGRKKYEEACNKDKSLVLGLPKEVKAPKEGRMSYKKRRREQHAKEGGKRRRVQSNTPRREGNVGECKSL